MLAKGCVIYIIYKSNNILCCVGFASRDVVCDELNNSARNVVCSSFLITVCMFIVSKALLISGATAFWLNPFATVLFTVCSAVTVECCVLEPCCMGVFGMFAVM